MQPLSTLSALPNEQTLMHESMVATAQAAGLSTLQGFGVPPPMVAPVVPLTPPVVPPLLPVTLRVRNYGFSTVKVSGVECKAFSTTSVPGVSRDSSLAITDMSDMPVMDGHVNARGLPVLSQGRRRPWATVVRNDRSDGRLLKVWSAAFGMPWFCIAGTVVAAALLTLVIVLVVRAARRR